MPRYTSLTLSGPRSTVQSCFGCGVHRGNRETVLSGTAPSSLFRARQQIVDTIVTYNTHCEVADGIGFCPSTDSCRGPR